MSPEIGVSIDHTTETSSSISSDSSSHTPSNDRERVIGEKRESCVPFFDALWFCYCTFGNTPVYQMKEYYRYGTVDDCTGHWGRLMDCLKRKTTMFKEEAALDPNANMTHPLWQLRTGVEAKEFWRREFGVHPNESSAEPARPGQRTQMNGSPTTSMV